MWIRRYEEEGLEGLADRSRRPHRCPHKTAEDIEQLIVACRKKHPRWGPKKLLPYLSRRYPEVTLPRESTIGAIIDRHGLITRRRRRRPSRHPGAVPLTTTAPNQIWGADFKGQFKMRNGVYNFPLTVTDAHARYILSCKGLPSVEQKAIGLLDQTGDHHQRIKPGCPTQNSRHERMHKDLKAETARPPERNFKKQQRRFDVFREEFNEERPHETLGGATPASVYNTSPRVMPATVPEPEYPAHYEVRFVSSAGAFKWKKRQLFISQTLGREWIGLEEVDDGIWSIYFYDVLLARLDERDFKLKAAVP